MDPVPRSVLPTRCGCSDFCRPGNSEQLRIVTSSCGRRLEHLDEERRKELFDELERFGVRHDDPEMRNVTYRQSDGRFCVIDFEFATLLPDAAGAAPAPVL